MKRVESLDYLRGILAFSVMLYHYSLNSFGALGGETLLGKLGIYAVSIFYILSGLSLTIVYSTKITAPSDIGSFFIKRVFRIFPLFWIAITISLIYRLILSLGSAAEFGVGLPSIFLNYSLLFGFLKPTGYLTKGAWSIGNEMVFYSILPFVFFLSRKWKMVTPFILVASFISFLYFSFGLLDAGKPLGDQWSIYINPFNQLFLFMSGVAIGKWGMRIKDIVGKYGWYILITTVVLFVGWPACGDQIQIVTGVDRLIFSLLSILLVLMLYVINPILHSWAHTPLSFLGQGCYSIYLLHPLIATPFALAFSKLGINPSFAYIPSIFITLFASWASFKYIEIPGMNYGRIVAKMFISKNDKAH